MTGSKLLLDTNIVAAALNGEEAVNQKLARSEQIYVPAIVIGELFFGAYRSARVEANLQRIEHLRSRTTVIAADFETGQAYGRIKAALLSKGKPIPENDIWIAALALQHEMHLVTRDSHFQSVDDLNLEYW